ncbi:MAG: hypothetical protein GY923_15285 [Aestuariibacter sp.]|nr:hypothetical protein [Aestuariibacter sp.]
MSTAKQIFWAVGGLLVLIALAFVGGAVASHYHRRNEELELLIDELTADKRKKEGFYAELDRVTHMPVDGSRNVRAYAAESRKLWASVKAAKEADL